MAKLRHFFDEYSLVITLVPTKIPPTPRPVMTRQKPSISYWAINVEPNIPTADKNTAIKSNGRRPILSASGARKSDPAVMPNKPALNK